MFSHRNDNTNKTNFIEYLNEVLSLENAVLERLDRRIQETPVKNSQQRAYEGIGQDNMSPI